MHKIYAKLSKKPSHRLVFSSLIKHFIQKVIELAVAFRHNNKIIPESFTNGGMPVAKFTVSQLRKRNIYLPGRVNVNFRRVNPHALMSRKCLPGRGMFMFFDHGLKCRRVSPHALHASAAPALQ